MSSQNSEFRRAPKYQEKYFSDENPAYPNGYQKEMRIKKYFDVINNISRYFSDPILEIGCGPGYLIEELLKKRVNIIGCDSSQAALNLSNLALNRQIYRQDITDQTFTEMFSKFKINTTVGFHVLEHIPLELLPQTISGITQITLQRLYLIIPTQDGAIEKDDKLRQQILEDPYHLSILTRKDWTGLFSKYGWQENADLVGKFDRLKRGWVFVFDKSK